MENADALRSENRDAHAPDPGNYRTGQGNMTGEMGNVSMSNGEAHMNTLLSTQHKNAGYYTTLSKRKRRGNHRGAQRSGSKSNK
eukprot:2418404-Ditylum_brightwellii.AAC.1